MVYDMYNTKTLKNGMRVIHHDAESEVVYCGYAINAGARHEREGEEGLAHFCEHMAYKGTEKRTSMQIINTLERVGGEMNAYTAKEETVYYAAVLRQHFMKAVELLTDIVFHSTYPQQEIEKEKEVVCDEIDTYRDSPADLIYDEFENMVLGDTPLGHNVLGTEESVRSFTTEDCLRFIEREYRPERMVFYVHGKVDFKKLVNLLTSLIGRDRANALGVVSPEGTTATTLEREDAKDCERKEESGEYHQAHVMMGATVREDINKVRYPLFLVNNILGGPAMNSRFNISLREKRGLVYTVESLMTSYSDTLMWSVYFGCDKGDVKRCIRLVKGEMERLRKKPLTPAALAAAKRQIKGQMALAAENRENFSIDMAKQYLHHGTLRSNEKAFARIDAVTAEEIHQLMNTLLAEENMQMIRL